MMAMEPVSVKTTRDVSVMNRRSPEIRVRVVAADGWSVV